MKNLTAEGIIRIITLIIIYTYGWYKKVTVALYAYVDCYIYD